ncbi:hypothetical protein, partial [Phenylobacterium sp.]|uniref:hypothetical protein n=1 Tax=Phenylobacterium sp. TaxID=1871053 RepID=UPI0025FEFA92
SRALIILHRQTDRDRAAAWVRSAPWGTRITFQEAEQFGDIGRGMSATLYTLADSLPDTVLQSFARRTLEAHRNMRAA